MHGTPDSGGRPIAPRASVSIALAGSGGAGVMTAGNILIEAAGQAGYYGLMTRTSGPQIRGGEAAALVRIATRPIDCMDDRFQLLAAVDWENLQRFTAEIALDADSLIVGDPDAGEAPEAYLRSGAAYVPVALKKIAKSVEAARPNMVLLGVVAELIGLPDGPLQRAVERTLGKRVAAVAPSLAAVATGRAVAATITRRFPLAPPPTRRGARWLLTGNEAAGLGALEGGVRFVAAYPITPATEMLEWLAPALAQVGGTLVQAEDELASINMAIGASYGGVPSLTATSGPGLSLMVESLGLAVASETPVVVVDVMRVGPSTGIPTKSEQADLNIALHGMHGDAPHVVLAPNSIADCLRTTQWAVRLAEALQVPALVLSDQFLGQARAVVDRPAIEDFAVLRRSLAAPAEGAYRRYALTPGGVSPMAIPGAAGLTYTADGLEHGERGTPSSQAAEHAAQLDKRLRKLESVDYDAAWADIEGDGDLAIVTFGSCTGPLREALATTEGLHARLISLRLLAPLRLRELEIALRGARKVLVVEQNHGGQLLRYLRGEGAFACDAASLRKPGGAQFQPGELRSALLDWSRS